MSCRTGSSVAYLDNIGVSGAMALCTGVKDMLGVSKVYIDSRLMLRHGRR